MLLVLRVTRHNSEERVHEPLLCFLVILGLDWPFQQVDNELGSLFYLDVIVCLEME